MRIQSYPIPARQAELSSQEQPSSMMEPQQPERVASLSAASLLVEPSSVDKRNPKFAPVDDVECDTKVGLAALCSHPCSACSSETI